MSDKPPISIRHANRLAAAQFIYMWEVNPSDDIDESLELFFGELEMECKSFVFAEELIRGIIEHMEQLDETIQEHSQNWKFERIAKVDLAILRLAIYELFHRKDIPPIVSINEAIDLTKELSSEDSKRFVNGILDQVKEKINRPLRSAEDV